MKATFFSFVLLLLGVHAFAQTNTDTIPPYKKNLNVPDFNIQLTNNEWFTKKQIPPADFTIIIYFNPDCSHCQHEAKEVGKYMDSLQNVFFVWSSYNNMKEIQSFSQEYGFENLKNLKIGRDPSYGIPSFYQVKYVPFVAVYNKKGVFINAYEGGIEIPDLLKVLREYKN